MRYWRAPDLFAGGFPLSTQTVTFSNRLQRSRLPERIELEPELPEPEDVVADAVALLEIPLEPDVDLLRRQLAALRNVRRLEAVGVLAHPLVPRAAIDVLSDAEFVLHGYISDADNEYALRSRDGAARHLLFVTGDHFLPARSIRNFLEFHASSGRDETAFTPGPHESWKTLPVARCLTIDSIATRPMVELRRLLLLSRLRRQLRRLPRPVKRVLRATLNAAKRVRRQAPAPAAQPTLTLAGDGAPPAPAPAAPDSPAFFLGSPRDQVELLAERAGEFYRFPSVVNLVLTNLCNLKCVMCPYHSPRYEKGDFFKRAKYMTDEIFERVAQEAAEHGATLKLGQLEEVLIHPRLIPWIQRAGELGVPDMHITTNGTLMTPDKSEALMKAGLTSIYVSLDAATPETYKIVRGFKDGLEPVWKNIDALIENRDRYAPNTRIRTSFILQPEARHERDAFVEMWRERGIDGVIVYQLSEHYDEEGHADFQWKYFEPTPTEKRHACSSVWQEMYVYPEGEVSMCCNTMILVPKHGVISMGNVNEQSLSDIWLGGNYKNLRRRLLLNDIAGDVACQDCDIWDSTETRVEERDGMRIEMNPTSAIYSFR